MDGKRQLNGSSEHIELQQLPKADRSDHADTISTAEIVGSGQRHDGGSDTCGQSDPLDTTADISGSLPATGASDLDFRGTLLLAIQHASSSWGYRAAEFAYPLYMVELFTNTLLPASIYGFVTTSAAILFSNAIGRSIDQYSHTKLRTLRVYILGQKFLVGASYGLFLLLFLDGGLEKAAENGGSGPDGGSRNAGPWSVFAAITLLGCGVILSNVGVSIGIERDWVQNISRGSAARLTRLNAIMRRIDLVSKLLSPLFVSLLTTTISYRFSAIVLLALCALSAIFELIFIGTVYRRFPALAEDESRVVRRRLELQREQVSDADTQPDMQSSGRLLRLHPWHLMRAIVVHAQEQYKDWVVFVHMPVFVTSLCISLLYMSVLSFDPTFIAYLKSETNYTDAFVAGMRAIGVVAGLLGTIVMPRMEKKIGLVRTGSYSLWQETLSLIPGVVVLFVTGFRPPFAGLALSDEARRYRPDWNTGILFTSLAVSRIGLWSFDLAQLALLQTALSSEHLPAAIAERKNALMALQFSLQNIFDLGHYGLTLGWSRPDQFKYAAAVSLGAVGTATLLYLVGYARRVRGHIVHFNRLGLDKLLGKKDR